MRQLSVIGCGLPGRVGRVRRLGCLVFFLSVGLSATAQDAVPAVPSDPVAAALEACRTGQIETAQRLAAEIDNPAAKLFVQAGIERAKGDPKSAIQTLARAVVRYPDDSEWTAKIELMSARLYLETGMPDSADVTARQVQMFYEGTDVANQATALRREIEQLKNKTEEKGSIQ